MKSPSLSGRTLWTVSYRSLPVSTQRQRAGPEIRGYRTKNCFGALVSRCPRGKPASKPVTRHWPEKGRNSNCLAETEEPSDPDGLQLYRREHPFSLTDRPDLWDLIDSLSQNPLIEVCGENSFPLPLQGKQRHPVGWNVIPRRIQALIDRIEPRVNEGVYE